MKIIHMRFVSSSAALLAVVIMMALVPSRSQAQMKMEKMDLQVQKNPLSPCEGLQKAVVVLQEQMRANQCPVILDRRVECTGLPTRSGGNDGHWEFDNASCGDRDHRRDDGSSYNENCARAGGTCRTVD